MAGKVTLFVGLCSKHLFVSIRQRWSTSSKTKRKHLR